MVHVRFLETLFLSRFKLKVMFLSFLCCVCTVQTFGTGRNVGMSGDNIYKSQITGQPLSPCSFRRNDMLGFGHTQTSSEPACT